MPTERNDIGMMREEARAKKPVRILLLAGIGVMVLLLGIRFVPELKIGTVLPIRSVRIYGVRYLSKRDIVRRLGIESTSSLLFYRIRAGELSLRQDNRVAKVDMIKVYPDTLRVHVVEKEPGGLIEVGTHSYLVSADGVVLEEVYDSDYSDYPHITLTSISDDIKIGYPVRSILLLKTLDALAEMGREFPEFTSIVYSITIDDAGVSLSAREGRYRVYLGSDVGLEKLEKMRALILVLDESSSNEEGSLEIDMNFSQAAVREGEREHALR